MPTSWPAQPPCRTSATTPYAAATDSRFITAALIATATLRNDTSSSSIDSSTTPPMSSGIRLAMLWVRVDRGRGDAADVHGQPGARGRRRAASCRAARCTRSSVVGFCGPVVGMTVKTAVSRPGSTGRRGDRGDAGGRAQRAGRLVERRACATGVGSSATISSGPFEPGPEGPRLLVVRLPGGGALAVVAGVGEAEPDAEERRGQGEQDRDADDGRDHPVPLDQPAPARARPRDGSTCPPAATWTVRRPAPAAAAAGRCAGRGSRAAPGRA